MVGGDRSYVGRLVFPRVQSSHAARCLHRSSSNQQVPEEAGQLEVRLGGVGWQVGFVWWWVVHSGVMWHKDEEFEDDDD